MYRWKKTKMWFIGLAFAGIPLVTYASCDPATGWLDFYRNDDGYYYGSGYYDYYYDGYYYDDYVYTDYYYDDYYYDDCFYCFP